MKCISNRDLYKTIPRNKQSEYAEGQVFPNWNVLTEIIEQKDGKIVFYKDEIAIIDGKRIEKRSNIKPVDRSIAKCSDKKRNTCSILKEISSRINKKRKTSTTYADEIIKTVIEDENTADNHIIEDKENIYYTTTKKMPGPIEMEKDIKSENMFLKILSVDDEDNDKKTWIEDGRPVNESRMDSKKWFFEDDSDVFMNLQGYIMKETDPPLKFFVDDIKIESKNTNIKCSDDDYKKIQDNVKKNKIYDLDTITDGNKKHSCERTEYLNLKENNTQKNREYTTVMLKKKTILNLFQKPKPLSFSKGQSRKVTFNVMDEPEYVHNRDPCKIESVLVDTKDTNEDFSWDRELEVVEIVKVINLEDM